MDSAATNSASGPRWSSFAVLVGMALLLAACQQTGSQANPASTLATATTSSTPTSTSTTTSPPTTSSTTLAETVPSEATTTTEPTYIAEIVEIDDTVRARMASSWREGCPVPLENLRYVRLSHYNYEGEVQTGELVLHEDVAEGVVAAFQDLFDQQFPIDRMELVDNFEADDDASMRANNTSAFNCRSTTGGSRWSEHAFGAAIDINPLVNPYVSTGKVYPSEGAAYADRHEGIVGGIYPDDATVTALGDQGWLWGGYWSSGKDYQHFSISGR